MVTFLAEDGISRKEETKAADIKTSAELKFCLTENDKQSKQIYKNYLLSIKNFISWP